MVLACHARGSWLSASPMIERPCQIASGLCRAAGTPGLPPGDLRPDLSRESLIRNQRRTYRGGGRTQMPIGSSQNRLPWRADQELGFMEASRVAGAGKVQVAAMGWTSLLRHQPQGDLPLPCEEPLASGRSPS